MQGATDESYRISRYCKSNAQEYLAQINGEPYIEYRKNWSYCGEKQFKPDKPLQVNIELTSQCNLKCKMCYRNYEDINSREGCLGLPEIENIVQQCKEMQVPSIWLSGGEPLLHPDILDILKLFGSVGSVDYWMVSNGLLLNERIISEILDSGMTWLSISIDAATAKTYKEIRGGNLNIVHENIALFLKMRNERGLKLPFLRVSFIEMEDNKGEKTIFMDQWNNKADIIDIQTLANYHNLDNISDLDVVNAQFLCTAPFTLVSIIPNGDIIPCCNGFYSIKSKYNINNISILEYWKSDYHSNFAIAIKEKNYCSECIKCIKSFIRH